MIVSLGFSGMHEFFMAALRSGKVRHGTRSSGLFWSDISTRVDCISLHQLDTIQNENERSSKAQGTVKGGRWRGYENQREKG
ncbi:hypothetical protein KTT_50070 [Tengunoibacter tsumagoiensis]|uniref:Uncharacterized protein n=1 Tax=Tengunoibacter tsumagoiensis TaxID=2014871 RepID=A0A402A7U5_9CHLR|nr:hypothetical protein KTT_50070 [Tengunoibacter tsumagoiensis]